MDRTEQRRAGSHAWGFGFYTFVLVAYFFISADSLNRSAPAGLVWSEAAPPALSLALCTVCLGNLAHLKGRFAAIGTCLAATFLWPPGSNCVAVALLTIYYFSLLNSCRPQLTLATLLQTWAGCALILAVACWSSPHPAIQIALGLQPVLLTVSNALQRALTGSKVRCCSLLSIGSGRLPP